MKTLSPTVQIVLLLGGFLILAPSIYIDWIPNVWMGISALMILLGICGSLYGILARIFKIQPSLWKYLLAFIVTIIGTVFTIREPEGILTPLPIVIGGGVILTLVLQDIEHRFFQKGE